MQIHPLNLHKTSMKRLLTSRTIGKINILNTYKKIRLISFAAANKQSALTWKNVNEISGRKTKNKAKSQ